MLFQWASIGCVVFLLPTVGLAWLSIRLVPWLKRLAERQQKHTPESDDEAIAQVCENEHGINQ